VLTRAEVYVVFLVTRTAAAAEPDRVIVEPAAFVVVISGMPELALVAMAAPPPATTEVPLALDTLAEAAASEEAICEDLEACDAELDAAACREAEVEAAGGSDEVAIAGTLDCEETTTGGTTEDEIVDCLEVEGPTTTEGAVEVGGFDDGGGATVEDGGTSEVTTTIDVLAGTEDDGGEGTGVVEAIVAGVTVDIIVVVDGAGVEKRDDVVSDEIDEAIVVVVVELLLALCLLSNGLASSLLPSAMSEVENRANTGVNMLALPIIMQGDGR